MRLDREVKFTTEIFPACLPSVNGRLEGSQGTVVGWGNKRVQDRRVGVEGLVKGFGYKLSTIMQELDIRYFFYKLLHNSTVSSQQSTQSFVTASAQPASVRESTIN